MKKLLLKFSNSVLTRDELKKITGGVEGEGCPKCKADQSFMCGIDIGGGCICRASLPEGSTKDCENIIA